VRRRRAARGLQIHVPGPGPARAASMRHACRRHGSKPRRIVARGNKESVLGAESYRGGAPKTKICPSAWPVASGRPTNQPLNQTKQSEAPTKQSEAKAQSTLLAPLLLLAPSLKNHLA